MFQRSSLVFALSAFMTCPMVMGQAPSQDSNPHSVIRTTASEVVLDVVVRDKHHHVVRDLRPIEVQVYEDGVPQKIRAFRDVQGADQLQTERVAARASSKHAVTNAEEVLPGNELRQVNFVSVVFAQISPQNMEFAREAVREFLKSDNLPNTYITLYRLNRTLDLIRPFTDDKELLAKSIDSASTGLFAKLESQAPVAGAAKASLQATGANIVANPTTGPATVQAVENVEMNPLSSILLDPLWSRNASAQDASTNIGNALLTQADMDKGLRFATSLADGMNSMDSLRALVRSQEKLPGRKVVLYLADGLQFPVNRREVVDGLISFANRAGVTFYTVDTQGLSTEDPLMKVLSDVERVGAESVAQRVDPRNGHKQQDDEELAAVANDQLALRELAELTGGFAVANTNQIAEPMQRVMEDMRTHYELAYAPSSTRYDGHFRKIEVKIARRRVTVQTRKGYFALPDWSEEPLKPFEVNALNALNADPAPTAFPFHAALVHFRPKKSSTDYQATFEIPIRSLTAVENSRTGKTRVQASLVSLVHNAHGDVVRKISRQLIKEVPASERTSLEASRILYAEPLELPAGDYEMDTAVTDEQSGNSAVNRSEVSVGLGENLGLSSVEVVNKVEPLAGPRNPLNPFELEKIRIMPTLAESVAPNNPVAVYFVVYPSTMPAEPDPKVTLQLFVDGKEVARKPLNLPRPEADGSIPMLVQLTPGAGLCNIRITAQQGTLVAQSDRSLNIQ